MRWLLKPSLMLRTLVRETRNPGERRCRALAGRPESVYGYTEFTEAASIMSSCSSTTRQSYRPCLNRKLVLREFLQAGC
jgi:hypothetical protein